MAWMTSPTAEPDIRLSSINSYTPFTSGDAPPWTDVGDKLQTRGHASPIPRISGPWTLDLGLWTLKSGPWTMDHGPWTLELGAWSLDPGAWSLDLGPWTLDPGPWTLDPGPWTLDSRPWTLDPGPRTPWVARTGVTNLGQLYEKSSS